MSKKLEDHIDLFCDGISSLKADKKSENKIRCPMCYFIVITFCGFSPHIEVSPQSYSILPKIELCEKRQIRRPLCHFIVMVFYVFSVHILSFSLTMQCLQKGVL